MPYLLVFLPDEFLRLVRHSGQRRDGEVGAALPGQLTAERWRRAGVGSANGPEPSRAEPSVNGERVLAVALLHHHAGHALDAVGPVVLVVGLPGHVLQVLHVRADEHVPQLDEVAVRRVLHCEPQSAAVTRGP